jgi:adenylate cyclase
MAGNIGTPARMEYTVLGDPVNVAARLCKVLPVDRIAVGARTAELARGRPGCRFEDLGEVQLRGRERSIRCFEASAE